MADWHGDEFEDEKENDGQEGLVDEAKIIEEN